MERNCKSSELVCETLRTWEGDGAKEECAVGNVFRSPTRPGGRWPSTLLPRVAPSLAWGTSSLLLGWSLDVPGPPGRYGSNVLEESANAKNGRILGGYCTFDRVTGGKLSPAIIWKIWEL